MEEILEEFRDDFRDITSYTTNGFYSMEEDPEMIQCFASLAKPETDFFKFIKQHDCFLNLPDVEMDENPLNIENIKEQQDEDPELQRMLEKYPNSYFFKNIGTTRKVICYVKPGLDKKENWKIALPRQLLKPTIKWFHLVAGHPGEKRLEQTIRARYHHNNIRAEISKFKCPACQKYKLPGKGYGLLPERELKEKPFEECAVDLIGPWPVNIHGKEHVFLALTMIDPVTNLTELVMVDSKESDHIAKNLSLG